MTSEPSTDAPRQKLLISRSSILILGGVLMGLSCSEAFNRGLGSTSCLALLAALVGLFAFIAFDFIGRQRRAQVEHQQAVEKLEQRVSRHLCDES
jgi:hypothetical protein